LVLKLLDSLSKKAFNNKGTTTRTKTSIYSIKINGLDGNPLHLSNYKGRYLLIVNVASKCGFTPQYEALEKLYQSYNDRLMIIGVPSNQFGSQEPGSAQEIQHFCRKNYGVNFIMTEKVNVKGVHQHELYQWLTQKKLNGKLDSTVRWNFQKYLIHPTGELIEYFYSTTTPLSKKITRNIK